MKMNKVVIRRIAAMALILCLALLAVEGAAADDTPEKGFVLFGLSQLYDGTGQIEGGAGELLDGNKKLVDGLDSLGSALDEDIAGNLQTMKTGIDGEILPGLKTIIAGITDKVVPGVEDIREGLEDKMSPGLEKMLAAFDGQIIPGLQQIEAGIDRDMLGGLDQILGGLGLQVVPGLGQLKVGLTDQLSPGLGKLIAGVVKVDEEEDEPGLIQGLGLVSSGIDQIKTGVGGHQSLIAQTVAPRLGEPGGVADNLVEVVQIALQDISAMGGNPPANLWQDTLFAVQTAAPYIPGNSDGWTANELLVSKVVGTYVAINNIKALQEYGEPVIVGIDGDSGAFIIQPTGETPYYAALLGGLDEAKAGVGKIRDGVAVLDEEGKPKVTLDAEGNPDTLYAGLVALKAGVDGQMVAGVDQLLDGFNKTEKVDGKSGIIEGLGKVRGGLAGPVGEGLEGVVAGLSGEIVPGMTAIKEGMDEIMIPGTHKLLTGFNKTERVEGEAGIIEGLTKISNGLANPKFTPNPGGDPGVSDGLGLVISGIRTDVLDGIGELKGGIVRKIIPGLEKMITGITGELQPGFSKVSLLLLAIWLVSIAVFLVVGILIGRSARAKASSGTSTPA